MAARSAAASDLSSSHSLSPTETTTFSPSDATETATSSPPAAGILLV
jgi:hypothetical protein